MNFSELVKQIQHSVSEHYERTDWIQIVDHIKALQKELYGAGSAKKQFYEFSIDELSRIRGTLATLKSNLMEQKIEALVQTKTHKAELSVISATIRAELRNSEEALKQADMKAEVEKKMAKHQLIYDLHEAKYEEYQSLWYGIDPILHAIEQRIHVLSADEKTVKWHSDGDSAVIY